jgi:uncharacterized protein YidB (DUF937 family)
MSKSTPSLLALLGLVAVAGYQNRGKLADMLGTARATQPAGSIDRPAEGGLRADIGRFFDQGQPGGGLSAGLGDLVDRFRLAGRGDQAQSWVSREANMPLNVDDLESVLGQETLQDLGQKTGLSRAELLLRLNVALPEMVDHFTPDGRLPTETEAQARV